jgi:hypothetical protein
MSWKIPHKGNCNFNTRITRSEYSQVLSNFIKNSSLRKKVDLINIKKKYVPN